MARRYWKNIEQSCSVADVIAGGVGDIDTLKDDMETWRSNMEDNDMTHMPKYEEVEEAAQALDDACTELESAMSELESAMEKSDALRELLAEVKIDFLYMRPYKGKSEPRWMTRDNALAPIQALRDTLQGMVEEDQFAVLDDDGEPVEDDDGDVKLIEGAEDFVQAIDSLDDPIDSIENVEFPGMYG